MKQVKKLFAGTVLISIMFLLNSCGDGYKEFDLSQCKEVALQYLQEKYGEKFEVTDCWEVKKYIGSAGYVKVEVKKEKDDNDNKYLLIVYPKENKDENGDGYYDSYEVTGDNYIQKLYEDYLKENLDSFLVKNGFENFVSSVGVGQMNKNIEGYKVIGFRKEIEIENFQNIEIKDLLKKGDFSVIFDIAMCEKDYNDILESELPCMMQENLSEDEVEVNIYLYDENIFDKSLFNEENYIWPFLPDEKVKKIKIDDYKIEKS